MFSVPKLIVLALIVGAVWYFFKIVNRGRAVEAEEREQEQVRRDRTDAVDMTKCSVCGDFVPASGTTSCGRDGCPFPGA